MNSVQINELYNVIDSIDLHNKKIYFFGANKITELGIRHLYEKNIMTEGILDNNKEKKGSVIFGVKVGLPNEEIGEYDEDVVVFIASKYVVPMTKQLENMGYVKNKNIFDTIYHDTDMSEEKFIKCSDKIKNGYEIYKRVYDCKKLIICPYKGIGDAYFIGAYLDQYVADKKIDSYKILVVGKVCAKVMGMFQIRNIDVMSQEDMDALISYISFVVESICDAVILNHNYTHIGILSSMEVSGKMRWGDIFLKGIMELSAIKEPKMPLSKSFDLVNLDKKSFVISPYANTVTNIDMGMWEKLVKRLNDYGYKVYTNSIGPSEPAIAGSGELFISLEEAVSALEKCAGFIGVRSGFCDVISQADTNIIVLYPDKSSLFFNISNMGFGKRVQEIDVSGMDADYIVDILIEKVRSGK